MGGNIRLWRSRVLLASAAIAGFAGSVIAAETHPFGIDDYSALHSSHAVAISPDGKSILYDLRTAGEKGPTKHEWRLIDFSGENSRKLNLPEHFEPSGFARNGALFGTWGVEKLKQLAIVPLTADKPIVIFALPKGVQNAIISPDGRQFAVLADPRAEDPLAEVRNVVDNDESSVYVLTTEGGDGSWWCPNLKFATDIAWSKNSAQLAVMTQIPKIGHHQLGSAVNICSSAGSRLVADIANGTSGIAWSADEKDIIFSSTLSPTLTAEHVWSVPAAGGTAIDRTPQLLGMAETVRSDAHGNVWVQTIRGVITEADTFSDGKLSTVYRWPGGVLERLPVTTAFPDSPELRALSVQDPQHATNLAVEGAQGLKKITHDGEDTLSKVALGEVKVVRWTSKEGVKLEGIVTFPPGYTTAKKYPFLVFPHGGPEGNDPLGFDPIVQFIAGLGYVVLQPEYRGSVGYGSEFMTAIYQHFGDRAYRDVDSATDFALAQGWADPNRLAMFGWSAGGFMTSWTVTQTHRYKAAIEGAGITDWLSFIPTSDTWQTDYDARLQEKDPNPMLRFSAVMHADQVTTPLLILHGESDIRVPTFQGREFYVLLKERGKTVRMVTYPGSPHFPVLAEQVRNVFQEIADWLAKYNPA
jgi:dipeptidyl aminopeptidase/acylaminoacyl peptidase